MDDLKQTEEIFSEQEDLFQTSGATSSLIHYPSEIDFSSNSTNNHQYQQSNDKQKELKEIEVEVEEGEFDGQFEDNFKQKTAQEMLQQIMEEEQEEEDTIEFDHNYLQDEEEMASKDAIQLEGSQQNRVLDQLSQSDLSNVSAQEEDEEEYDEQDEEGRELDMNEYMQVVQESMKELYEDKIHQLEMQNKAISNTYTSRINKLETENQNLKERIELIDTDQSLPKEQELEQAYNQKEQELFIKFQEETEQYMVAIQSEMAVILKTRIDQISDQFQHRETLLKEQLEIQTSKLQQHSEKMQRVDRSEEEIQRRVKEEIVRKKTLLELNNKKTLLRDTSKLKTQLEKEYQDKEVELMRTLEEQRSEVGRQKSSLNIKNKKLKELKKSIEHSSKQKEEKYDQQISSLKQEMEVKVSKWSQEKEKMLEKIKRFENREEELDRRELVLEELAQLKNEINSSTNRSRSPVKQSIINNSPEKQQNQSEDLEGGLYSQRHLLQESSIVGEDDNEHEKEVDTFLKSYLTSNNIFPQKGVNFGAYMKPEPEASSQRGQTHTKFQGALINQETDSKMNYGTLQDDNVYAESKIFKNSRLRNGLQLLESQDGSQTDQEINNISYQHPLLQSNLSSSTLYSKFSELPQSILSSNPSNYQEDGQANHSNQGNQNFGVDDEFRMQEINPNIEEYLSSKQKYAILTDPLLSMKKNTNHVHTPKRQKSQLSRNAISSKKSMDGHDHNTFVRKQRNGHKRVSGILGLISIINHKRDSKKVKQLKILKSCLEDKNEAEDFKSSEYEELRTYLIEGLLFESGVDSKTQSENSSRLESQLSLLEGEWDTAFYSWSQRLEVIVGMSKSSSKEDLFSRLSFELEMMQDSNTKNSRLLSLLLKRATIKSQIINSSNCYSTLKDIKLFNRETSSMFTVLRTINKKVMSTRDRRKRKGLKNMTFFGGDIDSIIRVDFWEEEHCKIIEARISCS